jgi:phage gp29-like protein
MEYKYDQDDFDIQLYDNFFEGHSLVEIELSLSKKLKEDPNFKMRYERWLKKSGYKSWNDFYRDINSDDEDEDSDSGIYSSNKENDDEYELPSWLNE